MSTSSETAWADYHAAAGSWEAWVDAKLADQREHILGILTEVLARVQRDFAQTVLEVRAASRPADGRDGRSLVIRDTYDANARYHALDVIALDGASFVARRDSPGPCPGDGWQMVAQQGKRGRPGPQGERGEKGRDGLNAPRIVKWELDRGTYTATPIMSDGTKGPGLELRALFAPSQDEGAA
jgi:hypothetical protein